MSDKNKIYKGHLYEFTLGNSVGKGGNGRVFEVIISNPKCKECCVVKILSLSKWKDKSLKGIKV